MYYQVFLLGLLFCLSLIRHLSHMCLYLSHLIPSNHPASAPHLLPELLCCRLTWQDDIWEAQFACECQSPVEYSLVLSSDLLQVTPQQLQGNDEALGGSGWWGHKCMWKGEERANEEVWISGTEIGLK